MKTKILGKLMILTVALTLFVACQTDEPIVIDNTNSVTLEKSNNGKGFVHGIVINIDGEDYYFAGAPAGPNRETDVPGHYWRMAGKDKVMGKHYNNMGPMGKGFWASESEVGAYLYTVTGIIDIWTPEIAEEYAAKGFVHRHEFVKAYSNDAGDAGDHHPSKVIWLKHIAVTHFEFDGPMAPNMMFKHSVSPGLDWEFPNNYMKPYPEN